MKAKMFRMLRSALALLLAFSMVAGYIPTTVFAAQISDKDDDGTISYVALGASNTNGFGLMGYLSEELYNNPTNKMSGSVYGYKMEPAKAYPTLVAEELKSITGKSVELEQLAISSMRAEELHVLLDNDYNGDKYTEWRFTAGENWFNMANPGGLNGLRAEYQNYVKNADVITVDIGANNFGVYASNRIFNNMFDADFTRFDEDTQKSITAVKAKIQELLDEYAGNARPAALSGMLDHIVDTMTYALVGFCVNFDASMARIFELNPDATVVVVNIQNLMHGLDATLPGMEGTVPFGEFYGAIVDMANLYAATISPYCDKYVYAYAGGDGQVETFLKDVKEYTGNPEDLRTAITDCFDVYDNDIYAKTRVLQAFALLMHNTQPGSVTIREGYKHGLADIADTDDPRKFGDAVYDNAISFGGVPVQTFLAAGEINELGQLQPYYDQYKAALMNVYDTAATIMHTGATSTVMDIASAAENFDSVGKEIMNQLFSWLEKSMADPEYDIEADDEFKATLNDSTRMAILTLGVRSDLGNSFFSHPNENGHVEVKNAIIAAIKEKISGMDVVAEDFEHAPVAKDIYFYMRNNGYITDTQALDIAHYVLDLYMNDEALSDAEAFATIEYVYNSIFQIGNDDFSDEDRLSIIGGVYEILKDYNYLTAYEGYLGTLEKIVAMPELDKVSDAKAFDLVEVIYEKYTEGGELDSNDVRYLINYIWFETLGAPAVAPVVLVAEGTASAGSSSGTMTAADRIAVLEAVFAELKTNGVLDSDNEQLKAVSDLYDNLTDVDAEGDQIVPDTVLEDLFSKVIAAVADDENFDDEGNIKTEAITEVTTDITNTILTSPEIKPENKVVIVEEVTKALGESGMTDVVPGVGGSGEGTPDLAPHMEALNALRARLKAANLLNETQEGQIIEEVASILPTVMGGQTPSDDQMVAVIDGVYNIVFNREDLTIEDKIAIVMITLEVLEEHGYIDDAYTLGYETAKSNGYVDEAVKYIDIAIGAVATAKKAVEGFAVEEKYAAIKGALLAEIDATTQTLNKISELLASDALSTKDGALVELLKLKSELNNHIAKLKTLAQEIGFVADPYIQAAVDAYNHYSALITEIAEEAYKLVAGIDDAYAELVEEIGKVADKLHPDLGAAVRKYLTEVPADALAILYAHGEDAVELLIVKAALASGDIYDIYNALAPVVKEHGAEIYEIIATNDDTAAIIEKIEAAYADLLKMYEAASKAPVASAMNADIVEAQNYIIALYNALYPHVGNIVADVAEYPEYDALINAAWDALMDLVDVAGYAGEYGQWIAGDVKLMLSEQVWALFANNDEFMQVFVPLFLDNVKFVNAYLKNLCDQAWDTYLCVRGVVCDMLNTIMEYGDKAWTQIKHQLDTLCGNIKDELNKQLDALKDLVDDILKKADAQVKEELQKVLDLVDALLKQIDKQLDTLEGIAKEKLQAVYDALIALKDALEAAISDATDGAITNLKDALIALEKAVKDAAAYLNAEAQAMIAKIVEIIENLYWNATHDYYMVDEDSYYVAIGDGTALAHGEQTKSYVDLLAADLGVAYKNLAKNGMLVAETYELLKANKAEIAKANLITVGFGSNSFVNYAIDSIGAGIFTGKFAEHDWASVIGAEGVPYVEEALAAIYEELAAKELGTLSFAGKELDMAQLMTVAVESYAYAAASYATELPEVVNAIHAINPNAVIAIVGMFNPNDDVVIKLGETAFDIGEYVDYLVTAANVHNFTYALVTDNAFFVEAADVATLNTKDALGVDEFLFQYLDVYGAQAGETMNPSDEGHAYIKTQIREALVLVNPVDIEMTRMILGNELALQFAFKQSSIIEGVPYDVVITKTYADGRENKVVEIPKSEWKSATIDGVAYYYVSFNGIAAKEMSDNVYVDVVVADKLVVSDTYEDSIRTYAVRQLKKAEEDVIKSLYVDMLNYGAAAQTYFGYDAENLANADLTEAEQAYATKTLALEGKAVVGTNYVASQLNLASSIQLRVKFNNIDSSMYAVVKFTNHVGREIEVKVAGSEFLYDGTVVVVNEIVAADYAQDVTVTVYNANGEAVATAVDSVANYIGRMTGGNAIYDAVAKYCASAHAYLHK